MTPLREDTAIKTREGRVCPLVDVNSVGDGPYTIAGKELARGLRVAPRDTIDVAAEVEREAGHVEPILAAEATQRIKLDIVA
jgi:hypothetical protein